MGVGQVRHIIRDILVWAIWTLLKGTPFHGQSYGDLRRLSVGELLVHLIQMGVAVSGVAWLYVSMPNHMHWFYSASFLGFATLFVFWLGVSFVATWVLDRELAYV